MNKLKRLVRTVRDYYVIKNSGLFDAHYYLTNNTDVRHADINPLKHYVKHGGLEGRNPSAEFDGEYYLNANADVKEANINPLAHYIKYGAKEGRSINNLCVSGILISNCPKQQIATTGNANKSNQEVLRTIRLINPVGYKIKKKLIAPKFNDPKVSIIIPAYNQENYTLACIESILTHTEDDVSYEIIIADDFSPNEAARNIGKHLKNILVISGKKNQGFLLNCNHAANYANGKYILFLNNDTNVQPNWLNSLVSLIESDNSIGMVGSKLVYPNGLLQEAGGIIWSDASGWNFGRLDDPRKPEYNYVKEVDYISGAAIMLSKQLWDDIGGFDERYIPAYYEDSDLAFEVRKRGYKVMYQPKSTVVHFEGISHGTDLGSGIKGYQVNNRNKFLDKWNVELIEQFDNAQDVFLARDRSASKSHILVIDHYVPHYDKDAGSRTMWQYLMMFRELGIKVTFVGDNYYKHEPYTTLLEQAGIEVLYGPYYALHFKDWLINNGHNFDSVYLLRPHISIKYIDLVKKYTQAKIFYNGTDFHFLRMQREYEISKDPKLLNAIKDIEKQEIELFQKSDCVLTISDYEKVYFEQKFPDWQVKLIPTFIYKDKLPLSDNNSFESRNGVLFVGGFSHTPNVIGLKWFLEKIWPLVIYKVPDLKFYIVGSNMPEEISQYANENIIPKGFLSDEALKDLYDNVRVVVAPLTFGAGVKGKLIESVCHAVPSVTTSIGAEGIVDIADVISVQDSEEYFAKEVISLSTDSEKWSEMRLKEVEYARKYYSYPEAKKLVNKIFGCKK